MMHKKIPSALVTRHIRTYFRAKDENRPHLMARAFAPDVALQILRETDAIDLPPAASGLKAVTDALVRDFGRKNENVYSFCFQDAGKLKGNRFDCRWLVAMTVRATREVRVGCGRYEWCFQPSRPFLVNGLRIVVDAMQVLPPRAHSSVYGWVDRLPYPWCTVEDALSDWPEEALLAAVRDRLANPAA